MSSGSPRSARVPQSAAARRPAFIPRRAPLAYLQPQSPRSKILVETDWLGLSFTHCPPTNLSIIGWDFFLISFVLLPDVVAWCQCHCWVDWIDPGADANYQLTSCGNEHTCSNVP